jgi:Secretion system C-terminal sorting domain
MTIQMKIRTSCHLLLFGLLFLLTSVQAQSYYGNILLETQEEIDAFVTAQAGTSISVIHGTLYLGSFNNAGVNFPNNITDISYFSDVDTIYGSLVVATTLLTDLDAFTDLDTIAGSLLILQNTVLTSIAGLSNMQTGSAYQILWVLKNHLLTNLNGLEGVTGLHTLRIVSNYNLLNINALSNLKYVWPGEGTGGDGESGFNIQNNYKLQEIDGFHLDSCWKIQLVNLDSLTKIGLHIHKMRSQIRIQNCDKLESLDEFVIDTFHESIVPELEIMDNQRLKNMKFVDFSGTNLDIVLIDNLSLDSISNMQKAKVCYTTKIWGNPALKTIRVGNNYLTDFSGTSRLSIINNDSLVSISINGMDRIDSLSIQDNALLTEIIDAGGLSYQQGNWVVIDDNPHLKKIGPVEDLRTAYWLQISGCHELDTIDFYRLKEVPYYPAVSNSNGMYIDTAIVIKGFDSLTLCRYVNLVASESISGFEHLDNRLTYLTLDAKQISGFNQLDSASVYFLHADTISNICSTMNYLGSVGYGYVKSYIPIFPNLDTTTHFQALSIIGSNIKNPGALGQFRVRYFVFAQHDTTTVMDGGWHPGYTDQGLYHEDLTISIGPNRSLIDVSYLETLTAQEDSVDIKNLGISSNDSLKHLEIANDLTFKYCRIMNNPNLTECEVFCKLFEGVDSINVGSWGAFPFHTIDENAFPCNYPDYETMICDSLTNTASLWFDQGQDQLTFRPNPAQNMTITEIGYGTLEVFDVTGRKLDQVSCSSVGYHSWQINVSSLVTGVYYVRYISEDSKTVRVGKLVVQ